MSKIPEHFLVFDVESMGLHGEAFAVGYVLIRTSDGSEVWHGLRWCDAEDIRVGYPADREWIAANVAPMDLMARCVSPREVRNQFAMAMELMPKGTLLAADVAWPVEARFLAHIIDDDPKARAWFGPYPLIDIASVRFAAGLDPLESGERRENELPAHNPLSDARQSARLLLEALR